jgi:hypothetical protein
MAKTIEDYMNDPDIIHEPAAMREIHAIRLKIHDETRDMTASEHTSYFHERAADFLAETKTQAPFFARPGSIPKTP